jgi:hypothetical protein
MKITILDGSPSPDGSALETTLAELGDALGRGGHEVSRLVLRDLDLRPCVGCFGCWVKTPGQCRTRDGSHEVCRAFVASDLVIFASPLVMGFTSALLKNAQDKLIPVLHPHPMLYRGEMHHVSRYDRYPLWGLVLEREEDTDEEDVSIVTEIYERDSINFKTSLRFTHVAGDPVEDMVREIDGL